MIAVKSGPLIHTVDETVDEVLRDGEAVTIRAIRRDDQKRLAGHFLALSPDSRYRRFFGLRHNFGPRELDRLITPEYPLHIALVAAIEDENGEEVIIGDARCVASPARPEVSELALSVSDTWQGRGVAALLIAHLVRWARRAGVRQLTAEVMASNTPALHFLIGQGFRVAGRTAGICSLVRFVEETAAEGRADAAPVSAIRERAYQLYLARGGRDGMDFDDWLAAEREMGCGAR